MCCAHTCVGSFIGKSLFVYFVVLCRVIFNYVYILFQIGTLQKLFLGVMVYRVCVRARARRRIWSDLLIWYSHIIKFAHFVLINTYSRDNFHYDIECFYHLKKFPLAHCPPQPPPLICPVCTMFMMYIMFQATELNQ